MPSGLAGGFAGGGALTLLSTAWLSKQPVLESRTATRDDVLFEEWPQEDWGEQPPECQFWNGTVRYTSNTCSHFALSRVAGSSSQRAVERAVRCAARHETDCILSAEIGFSVPACFVYDPSGMRMIIAPRLLPHAGSRALIRVNDQNGLTGGFKMSMNRSVRAEFLPGGSRVPVTETLDASAAYCVQLLRAAYADACWAQLD